MEDPGVLLALCAASHVRRRTELSLKNLRRRVNEEKLRAEWRRAVRVRHYITLAVLKSPEESAWADLWANGSDLNFLNLTSLTRNAFEKLLAVFMLNYDIPVYNTKGGRPRKLKYHHQVLGLILIFYVGSMHRSSMCIMFGVTPSTLARALNKAEVSLYLTLKRFTPARIVWPTLQRQKALAKLVAQRQPLLQFTWGFLDGKNYRILQPSNPDIQNAHYNGWLHSVFVTGTLCFAADGLIVWAKHNCPGSWNDGDTSVDFCRKLVDEEYNPDPRYGVVADSAFRCDAELTGRVLTPLKEGDVGRLIPSVRQASKVLSSAITFIRQSAEWGMGSVQKVYHRLMLPLPPDKAQRGMRLENLFRLANFRVREVGISQIRTTHFHGRVDSV